MLSPRGRMEEFITEEEEPWYDQQDLEQGKTHSGPGQVPAGTVRASEQRISVGPGRGKTSN